VLEEDGTVLGIITDGDLRRMLEKKMPIQGVTAKDICTNNPKTIDPDELAIAALDKLRQFDITHLVVVKDNQYLGILHLHDLVREGLI
jgi:arabinose-5-phosphate isomerase